MQRLVCVRGAGGGWGEAPRPDVSNRGGTHPGFRGRFLGHLEGRVHVSGVFEARGEAEGKTQR